MTEASPFVVGAKVGVTDGRAVGGIREDEVAKVYKSGNFVLASEPGQQWRSYQRPNWKFGGEGRVWVASPTGARSYSRRECQFWDEKLAAQRAEKAAEDARYRRWLLAQDALGKMRHDIPSAEFLDKIEAAFASLEVAPTPSSTEGA